MGLTSALVDRARTLRQEPATGQRVAGRTPMLQMPSAWFPARLEMPAGNETPGPQGGRRRSIKHPTLMIDSFDDENQPVSLTGKDKVEVESIEYGRAVWELEGDPQPIRKREEVIAYQATIKRIDDREFEPVAG